MPRRQRVATSGVIFHVLNRGAKKSALFDGAVEFDDFEQLLQRAAARFGVAVFAYCLMSNHWHLVISPAREGALSKCMHWLTTTHVRRWQIRRDADGLGAVYQGRFRAIPIEGDRHFLSVCRYVERNPLRARIVETAGAWRWSSLWQRAEGDGGWLTPWPVDRDANWADLVDRPQSSPELTAIRQAITSNQPFGSPEWQERVRVGGSRRGRGRRPSKKSVL